MLLNLKKDIDRKCKELLIAEQPMLFRFFISIDQQQKHRFQSN